VLEFQGSGAAEWALLALGCVLLPEHCSLRLAA
jgi:hypothetical protein